MFYKCIESCIYLDRPYSAEVVYPFSVAPVGDGAAYFQLFPNEQKRPWNLRTTKGLNNTLYIGAPGWTDLRFPVQAVRINPVVNKPDVDYDTVEVLFDDTDIETVVSIGQMDHSWKAGSELFPHVHWIQDSAGAVVWQLEYKIWNNNELEPAGWTTLTTEEVAFAYASGNLAQISIFPAIPGTDLEVSFLMKLKVSRLGSDGADTKVGDAKFIEFDIHFEMDSWGSGHPFEK